MFVEGNIVDSIKALRQISVEWDNEGVSPVMNNTHYIIVTNNTPQLSEPIHQTMFMSSYKTIGVLDIGHIFSYKK